MNVRRTAAVLAAAAVIGGATPAVAADPSPSPSVAIPAGLYGRTDPTYDGVWRQSLALLAQNTVGVRPASSAIAWLTGQQCANGAFAAFRADTAKPCDAKLMVDTNSTAAAVQALAALGNHTPVTAKSVAWLKSVQNADGGWGYSPGGASDANSTAVVVGALTSAGEQPQSVVKGGKSPYDALLKLALPCTGDGAGAFAYQPDKKGALVANADATAAAVTAALGKGLGGAAANPDSEGLTCKAPATDATQAARNGTTYLARELTGSGHLTSSLPGAEDQPDYGNTADAIVALATAGQSEMAVPALHWLQTDSAKWAQQAGPAAYAQLILAATAVSADPRHFGSQDLVALLNATGPGPVYVPTAAPSSSAGAKGDTAAADDSSDSGSTVWIAGGILLVVVAAVGFMLFGRSRNKQS
ncbi:prenyltransferase/squalene oxidase repeat-containing protein [Streptomyces sp. NPDC002265]|uniref:prenyltransferase/squalene oxidase repeat-containing protein n=1 Tax=Streptomyces sp. NPDC002265 TaxID=3154415 RepID=UPI00332C48D4